MELLVFVCHLLKVTSKAPATSAMHTQSAAHFEPLSRYLDQKISQAVLNPLEDINKRISSPSLTDSLTSVYH